jgi:hypothetical protein
VRERKQQDRYGLEAPELMAMVTKEFDRRMV